MGTQLMDKTPIKIPVQVLLELQVSQLRSELAAVRHELVVARVERDLGFRFDQVTIGPDGSVMERAEARPRPRIVNPVPVEPPNPAEPSIPVEPRVANQAE